MRTRKTIVILISGKAGSGKSTISDMLAERLQEIGGISIFGYSFASPIKYIAKSYGGWDSNKDTKGRKLLQDIGRIFRDYDPNIWVKHFFNQMDRNIKVLPFNFAIIDDWRFPNEKAYIDANPLIETVAVRVFGRGGLTDETSSDISENSLPEVDTESLEFTTETQYDLQIDNSGDLSLLNMKLELVIASLRKQYIVE